MALLDIQLRPSQPVQLKSPRTDNSTVLPKFEETLKAASGEAIDTSVQKQQHQQQHTADTDAKSTGNHNPSENHPQGNHYPGFKMLNVDKSITTPTSALSTPPAVKPSVEYESKPNFQSSSYKAGEVISHPLPTPPSKLKTQDSPSLPTLPSNASVLEKTPTTASADSTAANDHQNNKPTVAHVNSQQGSSVSAKANLSSPVCRNCKTQTTPLWRRDETGQVLCNACGLFLKLHGRPRPISLKTDTIKSRNRVKQGGSSKGTSSTNTPELKSKDSKSGKKSPKLRKFKTNGGANGDTHSNGSEYTPLLPATSTNANSPAIFKQEGGNNSVGGSHSYNNLSSINGNGYYHQQQHLLNHTPHFPPHLPNHVLQAHQQQVPLHYPSSTPTQFAPGLRRITSPLMLSTTSSSAVRNEPRGAMSSATGAAASRSTFSSAESNSMHAAAGVLENLSNELGPSATFKSDLSSGSRQRAISLMNHKDQGNHSTVSTATGSTSSIFSSVTPPQLPRLPALSTKSPAFSAVQSRSSTPTLPPLHKVTTAGDITLPSLTSFTQTQMPQQATTTSAAINHPQQQSTGELSWNNSAQASNAPSRGETPRGNDDNKDRDQSSSFNNNNNNNNNDNNNNNGSNSNPSHEITILKTRISELELVNDLYRTRIMELEAMEHAARLRETSMRKRLEEAVDLQASQLDEYNRKQQLNASKLAGGSGQRVFYHRPNDPEVAAAVSNSRQVIGYQLYLPPGDQQMAQAQRLGIQLSERLGQSQKSQQQQQADGAAVILDSRSTTPGPADVSTTEAGGFKQPSLKRDNDDSSSTHGHGKRSKLK